MTRRLRRRRPRGLFPQPDRRPAPGDGDGVAPLGSAFGDEQVPPSVPAEQTWRLRVLQPGPRPRGDRTVQQLAGPVVDRTSPDPFGPGGEVDPAGPVVVPGEVGIDSDHPGQMDRVGPWASGDISGDEEVEGPVVNRHGRDHPQPASMEADGRRVDPAEPALLGRRQVELRLAIERVADLGPVDEVGRPEHRNTGEVGER